MLNLLWSFVLEAPEISRANFDDDELREANLLLHGYFSRFFDTVLGFLYKDDERLKNPMSKLFVYALGRLGFLSVRGASSYSYK